MSRTVYGDSLRQNKLPSFSHGAAYTIIGTIIVVLLTLLSVLLMGLVSTWCISLFSNGQPALSLLLRFTPCVTVNFIALECIFVLWDKKAPKRNRIVLLVAVILLVGSILVCATDVMICRDDGLHRIVLGKETKTYAWSDVTSATIGGGDTGLTMTLRFPGSKSVSLTGNSTAVNKSFDDRFGTVLGYAAYVRTTLEKQGTFVTVTVTEKTLEQYRGTDDWENACILAGKTE